MIQSLSCSTLLRFPASVPVVLMAAWLAVADTTTGQEPGTNRADEPMAGKFSRERALAFADTAARQWQAQRNCVTCHTNGLYLLARSRGGDSPAYAEARDFARHYLKQFIDDKQQPRGQRGSVEGIVSTTAYLAIAEQRVDGQLSPETTRYFEHIWELQDESGCWDWLKCNWPPFEVDDHYGATLVAIACGEVEAGQMESPAVRQGMARLRSYLQTTEPQNLHQKTMMLWAACGFEGIVDSQTRTRWLRELLEARQADGGWSTAELGSGTWPRPEGTGQDPSSDAYATALAIYVAHRNGISLDHVALAEGLVWLKQNQRESGRWFVRSLRSDNYHFISHAATNMALLALSLEP